MTGLGVERRTQAGAALDLLSLLRGRSIGVAVKYADALLPGLRVIAGGRW